MLLQIYRKTIAYSGMTLLGLLTVTIRYITLGIGINFNRTVIAPGFCRGILFLVGLKVNNKISEQSTGENVCYFFNHNSFLDIFIIPILGLKNTRFIITEKIKKIIPLHLCNLGLDVLYIPDTDKTPERIEFFKEVTQDLINGKYSIICSPEGRHDFIHGIASFNRGVFHMATASKKPIHLLFFDIPREANQLEEKDMASCDVEVRSLELISTEEWTVNDIPQNTKIVRNIFLHHYKKTYGDYGDSIK